ncbi:MAG: hypothetical protein FD123_4092 [Bacteroidetes bacterium]|nr:MAG: hypothetical protein FD123_4092 [Bacteroidota bacterium]
MKTIKIQIPDMQSSHDQARVNHAIHTTDGVTINSIRSGEAGVTVGDEEQQKAVVASVEKAGYTIAGIEIETAAAGKTFMFKTNINCSGCVARVTPALDSAAGVCHWDVDTGSKDKILSVHSDGITPGEIMDAVRKSGFSIEIIKPELV